MGSPEQSARGTTGAKVLKVGLSLTLLLGAAAYLLGGSLRGSLVYDRTVDQVLAEARELRGERVRVGGRLTAGSLQHLGGTAGYAFALTGSEGNLSVLYGGLWPDAAVDGRELMVEGTMGADGAVRADRVLARCPSRYKRRVTPEADEAGGGD